MGENILEQVLRQLRQENFAADVAYPGKKYPAIQDAVAAVHIWKVDTAQKTVTVRVCILCPVKMGGSACELQALRATAVLQRMGAACIQDACDYDGLTGVYSTNILAAFYVDTGAENCMLGAGFQIYIDDIPVPYVQSFTGESVTQWEAQYAIGQGEPTGTVAGSGMWKLMLEEQIPAGSEETARSADEFRLLVEKSDGTREIYRNCHWTSVKRKYTSAGLYRLRTGFALGMEED